MGQFRHGSATTTHAVRAAILRSQVEELHGIGSRAGLRAREDEPGTGNQPQDGREVAHAGDGQGYEYWTSGAPTHRQDRCRVTDCRRVPAAHPVAAGRLALCPKVINTTPDPLSAAFSVMAFLASQMSKATNPTGRSSSPTPSATPK